MFYDINKQINIDNSGFIEISIHQTLLSRPNQALSNKLKEFDIFIALDRMNFLKIYIIID